MTDTAKRKNTRPSRTSKLSSNKGNGKGGPRIEPGDAGIWATCDLGKEAKCVVELRDLLEEYADKLVNAHEEKSNDANGKGAETVGDIEASIASELQELQRPASEKLFTAIHIDVQCLVFFAVKSSIDPAELAHRICEDASTGTGSTKTRFVKRLTPVSLVGRASEAELAEVATKVLAPHFHRDDGVSKKFAIRPSIRNHNQLSRDTVIKTVAAAVGSGHKVDLKDFDLLILVDIYKNICGMSVVPGDYDRLKRYNVAELRNPTRAANDEASTAKAESTSAAEGLHSAMELGPARLEAGPSLEDRDPTIQS